MSAYSTWLGEELRLVGIYALNIALNPTANELVVSALISSQKTFESVNFDVQ